MQYKTWVAGLRRRKGKSRRLLQKRQNAKKTFTIKTYLYIINTDPSSCQGRHPMTNKTATVLTTAKI
jgi:hypothetical protein